MRAVRFMRAHDEKCEKYVKYDIINIVQAR